MDILTDYRIYARISDEHELARRAEQARVALERAPRHRHRSWLLTLLSRRTAPTAAITAPVAVVR